MGAIHLLYLTGIDHLISDNCQPESRQSARSVVPPARSDITLMIISRISRRRSAKKALDDRSHRRSETMRRRPADDRHISPVGHLSLHGLTKNQSLHVKLWFLQGIVLHDGRFIEILMRDIRLVRSSWPTSNSGRSKRSHIESILSLC